MKIKKKKRKMVIKKKKKKKKINEVFSFSNILS